MIKMYWSITSFKPTLKICFHSQEVSATAVIGLNPDFPSLVCWVSNNTNQSTQSYYYKVSKGFNIESSIWSYKQYDLGSLVPFDFLSANLVAPHTHTHTHTYIYIIYTTNRYTLDCTLQFFSPGKFYNHWLVIFQFSI